MKKLYPISILFFIFISVSCSKLSFNYSGNLLLTGIQGSKGSEIVCVNIDSNTIINTIPIDGYIFSTTVYDPNSDAYGYMNCDTVFILIKPETGELIKSIKLPGYISQVVIDTEDNIMIGLYTITTYGVDPDTVDIKSGKTGQPIFTNYIIRVNLSTGAILSDCEVELGEGIYATTYYYNKQEKSYVLYRSDKYLISINPTIGEIVHEQYIGIPLGNSTYVPDKNILISLTYSTETQRNYVTVIDPGTGSLISNNIVDKEEGYCANISSFDLETDCFITVNTNYKVLFYDISTGETKKTYTLENPMNDIKFWRR